MRIILGLAFVAISVFAAEARLADAVEKQDSAAVLALLTQKADVNLAQADGTTALMWAVRQDDAELVDRLLRAGAKVAAGNRYDITPLYLACVNANPAMIQRLLKAGADANATGPEGETALMTVAHTGNVEAAKVLLAHGAKVDARESWRGQTALMWAAGQSHPAMMRELLAHGADVNARSAQQEWTRQVTAEPREKWMPQGALTPLLFAARQGCLECTQILIEEGADLNAADLEGVSPLLLALINGHYDGRGGFDRQGCECECRGQDGAHGALCGGGFSYDAGVEPSGSKGNRQRTFEHGHYQDADRAWRECECAAGAAAALPDEARPRRRHHVRRGDDSAAACG